MTDERRLFPTKLVIAWPCEECEVEIIPGGRCFRVLDETIGFPVVCATCSGRLPGADGPICAGCFEPISTADGRVWKHEDGAEARTVRKPCRCDYGLNSAGKCIRCRGEGETERVDHLAWPVGRPKDLEGD